MGLRLQRELLCVQRLGGAFGLFHDDPKCSARRNLRTSRVSPALERPDWIRTLGGVSDHDPHRGRMLKSLSQAACPVCAAAPPPSMGADARTVALNGRYQARIRMSLDGRPPPVVTGRSPHAPFGVAFLAASSVKRGRLASPTRLSVHGHHADVVVTLTHSGQRATPSHAARMPGQVAWGTGAGSTVDSRRRSAFLGQLGRPARPVRYSRRPLVANDCRAAAVWPKVHPSMTSRRRTTKEIHHE